MFECEDTDQTPTTAGVRLSNTGTKSHLMLSIIFIGCSIQHLVFPGKWSIAHMTILMLS